MRSIKIKTFVILLIVLIFVNLGQVVFADTTMDYLFGDGDFQGTQYNSWGAYSQNRSISGSTTMQFSQDTTKGYTSTSAAQMKFTRIPGKNKYDTGWYTYGFTVPSGYSGASLNFYYQVTDKSAVTVSWEILDSNSSVKTSGQLSPNLENTWISSGVISISGSVLSPNNNYVLRLKSTISPSQHMSDSVWFDKATLNISFTPITLAPTIGKISPNTSAYIQAPVNLRVDASDQANLAQISWEYSQASGGPWTLIGTVTPQQNVTSGTFLQYWDPSGLTDATYYVRVTVKDQQAKQTSQVVSYSVDTHPPQITNITPGDKNVVSGYGSNLSADVSDVSGVKSVVWEYSTGETAQWIPFGTSFNPVQGNTHSISWHTNNVPDGNYNIRVRSSDNTPASLQGTSQVLSYTINNLDPTLQNITPLTNSVIGGTYNLSVDVPNAHDANPLASVTWELSTNGGTTWSQIGQSTTPAGSNQTYSYSWNTKSLPDGKYLVRITAVDATAIHRTTKVFVNYILDNTPPTLNRVDAVSKKLIRVIFNDANMNSSSALDISRYSLFETANPTHTLTITKAVAREDGSGINLFTADQAQGVSYTLSLQALTVGGNLTVGNAESVVKVASLNDTQNTIVADVIQSGITDAAGNILTGSASTTFQGSSQVQGNPHGDYLADTQWCSRCHASHKATGQNLLTQTSEKQVCYICHDDGGLSVYNVRKQFGAIDATGAATSHHGVPENTQQCSTCHDPHLGATTTPTLLKVKDSAQPPNVYNSGNNACWACHGSKSIHGNNVTLLAIPGVDDHETNNTMDIGLNGLPKGMHVQVSSDLAPTPAAIICTVCHNPHGSSIPKLLNTEIKENGVTTTVTGNDNSVCFSCHQNPWGRFLGQAVWEDTTYSAHSRPYDYTNNRATGALYPGGEYAPSRTPEDTGKCINCHNLHGTPNGSLLLDRFTTPGYNDTDAAKNFALCFKCHGTNSGPGSINIQQYFVDTYTAGSSTWGQTQGHFIKSTDGRYKDGQGRALMVGWKMPCDDCHNTHGSTGENRFLLRGDIDQTPTLTGLMNGNPESNRTFCTQCHYTADNPATGHTYRGGTIPKLAATFPNGEQNVQHFASATTNPNPVECTYCHGAGDLVKGAHSPNNVYNNP